MNTLTTSNPPHKRQTERAEPYSLDDTLDAYVVEELRDIDLADYMRSRPTFSTGTKKHSTPIFPDLE